MAYFFAFNAKVADGVIQNVTAVVLAELQTQSGDKSIYQKVYYYSFLSSSRMVGVV